MRPGWTFAALVSAMLVSGCRRELPAEHPPQPLDGVRCVDGETVFEDAAPDVMPRHRTASFWTTRAGDLADVPIMESASIEDMNRRYAANPELLRDPLGEAARDREAIARRWSERLTWFQERLETGSYVEPSPGALASARATMAAAIPDEALHLIAAESALWCVPTDAGILSQARDPAFDRNRCSGLHPGELVLATHRSEDGAWVHVEAGHADGWLRDPTWSAPLSRAEARAYTRDRPRVRVTDDLSTDDASFRLRMGTSFPLASVDSDARSGAPTPALLPRSNAAPVPLDSWDGLDGVALDPLPFTRRQVYELAFARLGEPYGWGGYRENRDCSRLMLDLLGTFGIQMTRNSALQATMGARRVSLEGMSDGDKLETLSRLEREGLVLAYMPGHIMLYLGEDGGSHYALSSLSEYLRPCPQGGQETVRLDRVEVTTLELGRGTPRTSFVERLSTAVVFGPA